ncbi:MAG: 4Fe-4S cluster-binding domain-containing protein, partial [Lachnospiraceae bacterium]|nr:4Fe-4S cluster-binding domain-containing protein [Lachnospiraceae bacterium]
MKLEYLSFLIKPASSRCNLHCPYCFYEDVSSRREKVCGEMMDEALMELLIDRAIQETSDTAHITLAFQGGEPMLVGLEFYEKLTAYA